MPHEKVERNRLMLQYHRDHPEATFDDIAQMFRLSKARVYEIIKREKGETTNPVT